MGSPRLICSHPPWSGLPLEPATEGYQGTHVGLPPFLSTFFQKFKNNLAFVGNQNERDQGHGFWFKPASLLCCLPMWCNLCLLFRFYPSLLKRRKPFKQAASQHIRSFYASKGSHWILSRSFSSAGAVIPSLAQFMGTVQKRLSLHVFPLGFYNLGTRPCYEDSN